MKKHILMAVILTAFVASAFAELITKNSFIYDVGTESATLVHYVGTEEKVAVSGKINNVPVTKIGNEAFKENHAIKVVSLGPSVVELGDEVFAGCDNLETVYVRNVTEGHVFGKDCFKGCENVRVRFVPLKAKNAAKSGAPKREGMIYVEGNGKIQSFYMDKFEMDIKSFYNIMDGYFSFKAGSINAANAQFPIETYPYIIIIFCNKLSIKEGRIPVYSYNGSTDPDKWIINKNYDRFISNETQWYDADGMLCRREGFKIDSEADGYRLPTVDEWLYAARGGKDPDSFKYPGSDDYKKVAICNEVANRIQKGGKMAPNKLGIYDMAGNVWEICLNKTTGTPIFNKCGGNIQSDVSYFSIDESFKTDGGYGIYSDFFGFRLVCSAK